MAGLSWVPWLLIHHRCAAHPARVQSVWLRPGEAVNQPSTAHTPHTPSTIMFFDKQLRCSPESKGCGHWRFPVSWEAFSYRNYTTLLFNMWVEKHNMIWLLQYGSHPLHNALVLLRSSFSERLVAPKCTAEHHRKSFLPVAIKLYNSSLW